MYLGRYLDVKVEWMPVREQSVKISQCQKINIILVKSNWDIQAEPEIEA